MTSSPRALRPPLRLTANLFGTAFGLCGLAQCWSTAHSLVGIASWPADVLWILAGVVWLVTLVAYLVHIARSGRLRSELADPTFAPFTSLTTITPMLLGVALAQHLPGAGATLFVVALILTVALGGWLTGEWIIADMRLSQWHPGYFLPTVAGGLVAAGGSAALGYQTLAGFMFGYGMTCWVVLGSILLLRLFTQPALPAPLLPTIAIELAPPVVAGNAWFQITGDRVDPLALGLAGYALLMVVVQLRLIPLYRRAPFGPGWWSFAFSYAAAFVVAIRWLAALQAPQQLALTYALLLVVTAGMGALVARTVRHVARGTYFPRASAPAPAAPAADATPGAARPTP